MNRIRIFCFAVMTFSLFFVLSPFPAAQPQERKPVYLEWMKEAEKGNHEKQYFVGVAFYREVAGAKQNYRKAFEWFSKAAENGNSEACVNLGDMYNYGFSVRENDLRAVKWYLKASEMGNSLGMEKMGDMYYFGTGVKQNYLEAAKWYRKAAEKTMLSSPYAKLGRMYKYGEGVKGNRDEALKWFLKADKLGEPGAKSDIGGIHMFDKKNYAEAGKWLRKGSMEGDIMAMYLLAQLYTDGKVPRNYVEACKWLFVLTEKDNYEPGKKLFNQVRRKMTKAWISKARRLASPLIKKLVTDDDRRWKEYSKTLKKL